LILNLPPLVTSTIMPNADTLRTRRLLALLASFSLPLHTACVPHVKRANHAFSIGDFDAAPVRSDAEISGGTSTPQGYYRPLATTSAASAIARR